MRLITLCENTAGAPGVAGEWGLAILVEMNGLSVLLDTGGSDAIVRNAQVLGVDLRKIDKVVLSHGHADHTGGLRYLLQAARKEMDVVAHPAVWGKKYTAREDNGYHFIGLPYRREELTSLGVNFIYSREPVWISDQVVTTGEVPLVTTFEQVDKNMYLQEERGFTADTLPDDQALVIISPRGLVVILGCAHRGMINTIIHAREITGINEVYMVVGGTHLFRAGREQVEKTIESIRDMGIKKLGVSHCTGLVAAGVLARAFPDAFFYNHAGTSVEI